MVLSFLNSYAGLMPHDLQRGALEYVFNLITIDIIIILLNC